MLSSMDRTLSDGKQLDMLFEQMLLQRTLQNHQHVSHYGESEDKLTSDTRDGESKWSEHKLSLLGGDSDVNWTG